MDSQQGSDLETKRRVGKLTQSLCEHMNVDSNYDIEVYV
jgi:hypothetical protein